MATTYRKDLAALDDQRLANNWTWDELAAAMRAAEYPIPARTLHYLVKLAPPDSTPLDRTVYKIRKYAELLAQRRKASARRRRPAARKRARANGHGARA